MQALATELPLLLPEAVLAGGLCLVLLLDLFIRPQARDATYVLAMLLLAAVAWAIGASGQETPVLAFGGSVISDPLSRVIKLFATAVVAAVLLYSRPYLKGRGLLGGEYYVLALFALLGIFVMASAFSLLVVYLGLELLSLSLYALVAFDRDSAKASEAAMKYFVLGAIASGTLLYGISLVYGATGSLDIGDIGAALASRVPATPVLWVGLAFIVAGIAFKFGAVPFHMWVPDVYEGAPVSVTLFVGTAPKLGAIALALRVLVDGLPALGDLWHPLLAALAFLSVVIGNVVAIAQTNIKRMLAYSTIAHVGFILLGLSAGTAAGVQSALFYTLIYVIMAAGAFGCVLLLSARGVDAEQLDDFRGLSQRNPWFAAMLMLVMVSMIGVPPLAGFYAKWWVLAALVDAGQVGLAVAALVFSVIGAFYYLRVIRLMYFEGGDAGPAVDMPWDVRLVLSANALLLLVIGLAPDRLLDLCARAASLI